ncbi:hypothetical protein ACIA8E_41360 [Streptomyces sp. NPDC051664]|uniref:hypothetical protein n=1 Tax=Streptomyces sp. NPDC051664 TaxID=3365668 RepID=UPI003797847C
MRLTLIGVAAALAVGALSGTAAAAGPVILPGGGKAAPDTVKVCAEGNYRVHASFPQQHTTVDVAAHKCSSLIHLAKQTNYVNVSGYWNTHPGKTFFIRKVSHLRASGTAYVEASGTTTKPHVAAVLPGTPDGAATPARPVR